MATPLFRALGIRFPEAQIDVLTGPWTKEFVTTIPRVHRVFPYRRLWNRPQGASLWEALAALRTLRNRNYDAVFTLEVGFQPSLLAFLTGSPLRFGYSFRGKPQLHTHQVERFVNDRYEGEAHLALAQLAGVEPQGASLEYEVSDEAMALGQARWADNPELRSAHKASKGKYLVFLPGGGHNPGTHMPEKRWAPERFAALAQRVGSETNWPVLLLGGPGDTETCSQVMQALESPEAHVFNLCPSGSFSETAGLLKGSSGVVSNDSFGLHLSAAVQAPVVGLFGPTDPETVAPRGENIWIVKSSVSADYKQILGTFNSAQSQAAMDAISVEEVWSAVKQMLP